MNKPFKNCIGLMASFLLLAGSLSWAASENTRVQPAMEPLKATITQTQDLPPEMYGGWSIQAFLVDTNLPNFFKPAINDIWMLDRVGEQVVISNPTTGASAAIRVDKVQGDTATFHRRMVAQNRAVFSETPTITVDNDRMVGEVLNRYEEVSKNGQATQYFAKYQLVAKRIGSARVQFGQPQIPDFEIEDVQPSTSRRR